MQITKTFKSRSFTSKKQRGFTLTELGIALALMAVLGAIALKVVPEMLAKGRASQLADAIILMVPQIQANYSTKPNISDLKTSTVANRGWIDSALVDGTNINSPWGSQITITGSGQTGTIVVSATPTAECNSLVTKLLSSDLLRTASINSTSVKSAGANSIVNEDTAGTQCKSSNSSTVTMTFSRT